jgi:hypothetical protein
VLVAVNEPDRDPRPARHQERVGTLTNKTQNGFVFWGLSKPPRKAGDPLVALERAWERYQGQVLALLKGGVTDDNRVEVAATIAGHVQAIESLREKVA